MNSIQLGIVAVIAFLILVTIGYYWYQEIRFKRIVENNFNNSSFDISEASAAMVLESNTNEVKPILQKILHNLSHLK